ncbi:MAG: hypothetical protein WDZ50_01070 [Woeseia sp.]
MKDKEDLKLEALFHSAAIDDAGFSDRIVRRIRWQIRVRRYSLPVAMLIGGLIAAKPAIDLLVVASSLITVIPEDLRTLPLQSLPQMSTLFTGIAIASVAAMCVRLLEQ